MKRKHGAKLFFGIRAKLNSSFILILLIVTAFIDIAVYQIYQGDIERKELTSMQDAGRIFSENIKNILDGTEEKIMNEIRRSGVFEYLLKNTGASKAEEERKLRSLNTLLHFRGLDCKQVLLLDREGNQFFYDYQNREVTLSEFKQREVYREIAEKQTRLFPARGCTIWRCYEDAMDEIYIIKSYIDPNFLQYCGMICLVVDRENFAKLLGERSFEFTLYEEQGKLLFSNNDIIDAGLGKEKSGEYLLTETAVARKRGNWQLNSYILKSVAFRDLAALMRMLILTEFLLAIIIIVIVYKITEGFLWNITALTENFARIPGNEEIRRITPRSKDETAWLCERFEAMYDQLQENARQMVLTNTLLDKAQYSALTAQMNPHFLYNTLESINAMARMKGQSEISEVIHMLSHLLRGALSDGGQEITLSGEIAYISCYLELQHIVTGERITWDISVDEELMSCRVPRLILQPIVENSILHGLDDMLEDAIVIITADVKEQKLLLTVSDNGKGADQKKLDEILSGKIPESSDRRTHIGVQSVLKRIRILYGDAYGMTMKSTPGSGTTTRIYLPYEKDKNTDRR